MSEPLHSVRVSNAELATVREAMRELHRLLAQLDRGELEKVVLTQRNQMRAVLITLERYNQLVEQHAAAGPVKRPGTDANGRGRDSEEGPLDASPAWRNPGR
jgi:PHD/YefM family antitoxin component YafN of YafNO toxin-antitoxin module